MQNAPWKIEEELTLPPRKAKVSAAIILLIEIKVATRPTVQWALPPRRNGHPAPISAKEHDPVRKYIFPLKSIKYTFLSSSSIEVLYH